MTRWTPTLRMTDALRQAMRDSLLAAATGRPCSLDPDLEAVVAYLFWLNACVSASQLAPSQLLADEAEALRNLDEVTRELSRSMVRCPHCGRLSENQIACSICKRSIPAGNQGGAS